ncbi:sulfotransferase family protein [Synechococcus sp. AH-601-O20]|nr:sulfotransferase family protein [Synechococcus sp. AH-601-O20]
MDRMDISNELKEIANILQKEQETQIKQRLLASNLGLDNICRYARDVAFLKTSERNNSNSEEKLILLKTAGQYESIIENKRHELAQRNTLVHLKSDSICTWIPKIACSTLRYSIALDNGAISGLDDFQWIHQNNTTFAANNKELLNSSYAFVILRNPFKRLLSFYLDKICSDKSTEADQSYWLAKSIFNTNNSTTFEEFVSTIYQDPSLISKDIHTRRQCDFLIYANYSDYFQFEDFQDAKRKLKEKIGLELVDTRESGSIRTTHEMEELKEFDHKTTASEANTLLDMHKKPLARNMYTPEMIAKVGTIYFSDILLYSNKVNGGAEELGDWMNRLRHLDFTGE